MKPLHLTTLALITIIFTPILTSAQTTIIHNPTAINLTSTPPAGGALLDLTSDSLALILPRMHRDSIKAPSEGMLIYDTSTISLWFHTGGLWIEVDTSRTCIIADDDGDTKIQVEESPDEDHIRFDIQGKEYFVMDTGRLHVFNTGYSIFIGDSAGLNDDYSNNNNVFIGPNAGRANTTGEHNIAIAPNSLRFNTSGRENTAIGVNTMRENTTGIRNVGLGDRTLYRNTTGNSNMAMGYLAMDYNTTGGFNVALGQESLYYNATGSYNTAVGYSCFNDPDDTNYSNSTAIGANAPITASYEVSLGDASVTSIGGYQNWSNFSDGRFKQNIQENVIGLDFILQLRPVTYHLDMDAIAAYHKRPDSTRLFEAEKLKAAMLQTGFIAQEVEQTAKKLGYDFSGVDAPKNENDHYGLRYAEFVVPLVKAMQEQQALIEAQTAKIEALEEQQAILQEKMEELNASQQVNSIR